MIYILKIGGKNNGGKNERINPCLLFIIIGVFSFSACGHIKYLYNNIHYNSQDEAIATQKIDQEAINNKIIPVSDSIRGSLIVMLPSSSYLKKNYPVIWNPVIWDFREPSKKIIEQVKEYSCTLEMNRWHYMAEAIRKRQLFDKIIIGYYDIPEYASFNEDYAIYLFFNHHQIDRNEKWILKKRSNPKKEIIIEEVSDSMPPVYKINLWLDNIWKATKSF